MSHSISYSVPSIGCGTMPFIVHLQTRIARARPLSSFSTSSGITPPTISMPSRLASSRSRSAAVICSTGKSEVRTAFTPSRRRAPATSVAVWPNSSLIGTSCAWVWPIWPRRRATEATSIEVSPPPTTTMRIAVENTQPRLNASRKSTPVMQFSASAPGTGSGRPFCAPIAQKIASKSRSSSSIVTSRPTLTPQRASTSPSARMRSISASSMSRGVR